MYELAFFDPIRSLQDMKDSSPQYLFEKNFILIPLVNELAVEKIVKSGEYHLLNDKMNIKKERKFFDFPSFYFSKKYWKNIFFNIIMNQFKTYIKIW